MLKYTFAASVSKEFIEDELGYEFDVYDGEGVYSIKSDEGVIEKVASGNSLLVKEDEDIIAEQLSKGIALSDKDKEFCFGMEMEDCFGIMMYVENYEEEVAVDYYYVK